MTEAVSNAYGSSTLAPGIRSRFVHGINGLDGHVLEAGFEMPGRPCVLLLHGFPDLAYSWRKVMLPLAAAGYHVVAPEQRGYGLTTGWDPRYDGDLASFRMLNLVRDALGLLYALGYGSLAGVVGHDFGSPVAALCALIRPDVFRSVALMSAPFARPPALPLGGTSLSPDQCEYLALEGISQLTDTLARIREALNPGLAIAGIVMTMYDERINLARQVVEEVRSVFGDQVFRTVIPRNVRLGEAPSFGKPVFLYDIRSKGADAYFSLAKEFLDHEAKSTGEGTSKPDPGSTPSHAA